MLLKKLDYTCRFYFKENPGSVQQIYNSHFLEHREKCSCGTSLSCRIFPCVPVFLRAFEFAIPKSYLIFSSSTNTKMYAYSRIRMCLHPFCLPWKQTNFIKVSTANGLLLSSWSDWLRSTLRWFLMWDRNTCWISNASHECWRKE